MTAQNKCRRTVSRWAALVLVAAALVSAKSQARGLKVGDTAPALALPDVGGKLHAVDATGVKATVLLFWRPDAKRSVKALCAVSAMAGRYENSRLLTIVSGDYETEAIHQAATSCPTVPTVLLDPDRAGYQKFQIVAEPALFVITPDHRLRCKSAGMGAEGLGHAESCLDTLYGRRPSPGEKPSRQPAEAVRKFQMAKHLLRFKMIEQGTAILTKLTEEFPDYRPAWVSLAYHHIDTGADGEAQTCLEKALKLDSEKSDVAAGFAWLWWRKGDRGRSADWARKVAEDDPHRNLLSHLK